MKTVSEVRTFRDLIAWQRGMGLTRAIYRATRTSPSEERFELIAQMRRAAVSIPSNIAEGFGRGPSGDFAKHLRIARGSLCELDTQVELSIDLELLANDQSLIDLIRETDRVLQALIRSIEK
jgi:four helix bundle protein